MGAEPGADVVLVGTGGGLRDGRSDAELELSGEVTALASRPSGPWAVTGERVLWRRTGSGWHRVTEVTDLRARCLLPVDGQALVGTSGAHLLLAGEDGATPVAEFDRVPGRDEWYTPWGGPPDTRSLSRDGDGTVYANVHVGGIVRSADGTAWEPTIDIHSDVHQVLAHPDRAGTVLAACAFGLATSDDAGQTWRIEDEGLHAPYARAVAVAGETVLLSASTGPRTRQAALYRRPLAGGRFERCGGGLPEWFPSNIDTGTLSAADATVAFGTAGGEVWISDDEGSTWTRGARDLGPVTSVLVLPRGADMDGGELNGGPPAR